MCILLNMQPFHHFFKQLLRLCQKGTRYHTYVCIHELTPAWNRLVSLRLTGKRDITFLPCSDQDQLVFWFEHSVSRQYSKCFSVSGAISIWIFKKSNHLFKSVQLSCLSYASVWATHPAHHCNQSVRLWDMSCVSLQMGHDESSHLNHSSASPVLCASLNQVPNKSHCFNFSNPFQNLFK